MSNVIQFPGATEGTTSNVFPKGKANSIMLYLVGQGKTDRVPTGWKTFDEASNGGFIYGQCTFICGAPNAGKTAMLACLTDYWTSQGIPVGALLVDESPDDFFMRWGTMLGYTMEQCDAREPDMLYTIGSYLDDKPMCLLGRDHTIEQASQYFSEFFGGRQIVMISDSLQRIRCEAINGKDSDKDKVAKNLNALEKAAKEKRWATVTTSEMSRNGYVQKDDFNDMSAGKHNGDIEYVAKAQLVVRCDKSDDSIRKVTVPKLKRGKKDYTEFFLKFNRAKHSLVEISPQETPKAQTDYQNLKKFFERNNWEFVGSKEDMRRSYGMKAQPFFELLRDLENNGVLHFIYSDKKFVWDINKR